MTKVVGTQRIGFGRMFRRAGYRVGAEIGVLRGEFSYLLCNRIPGLKLYCVDPYEPFDSGYRKFWKQSYHDDNYRIAQETLAAFDATFIRKHSAEAARDIPLEALDFVYIDGNHLYDYVMEDIIVWGRRVRKGGIISGHDYVDTVRNCGVIAAVDDYTRANNITEVFCTDDREPSFWWVKP